MHILSHVSSKSVTEDFKIGTLSLTPSECFIRIILIKIKREDFVVHKIKNHKKFVFVLVNIIVI